MSPAPLALPPRRPLPVQTRTALLSKRKAANREAERVSNVALDSVPKGTTPWERVVSVVSPAASPGGGASSAGECSSGRVLRRHACGASTPGVGPASRGLAARCCVAPWAPGCMRRALPHAFNRARRARPPTPLAAPPAPCRSTSTQRASARTRTRSSAASRAACWPPRRTMCPWPCRGSPLGGGEDGAARLAHGARGGGGPAPGMRSLGAAGADADRPAGRCVTTRLCGVHKCAGSA